MTEGSNYDYLFKASFNYAADVHLAKPPRVNQVVLIGDSGVGKS